jgi:acetyl esterase
MALTSSDPEVNALLDMMRAAGRPGYNEIGHVKAREVLTLTRKTMQSEPADVAEVRDLTFPGPAGPVGLRFYRGKGAPEKNAPCLVFFHGGGWVIGDLDSHDVLCRDLANGAECVVIAVDYRLAPEHKFPAAMDDSLAALRWIAAHAAELGIDGNRLAVGGDSAGGNIAIYACMDSRDNKGPALCYQLLFYPSTDLGMLTEGYQRFTEGPAFNAITAKWFRDQYLRDENDMSDLRASPLRAANFSGLPPALIITAGLDPLAEEGKLYADKLTASGVPVSFHHLPGQLHGFLMMGRMLSAAGRVSNKSALELKAAFARG